MKRIFCIATIAGALGAGLLAGPAQAALTITATQAGDRTMQFSGLPAGATNVLWSFGDNFSDTAAAPMHTFTAAGTWPVTVSATVPDASDPTGVATDNGAANVKVLGIPTPSFSYLVLANGTVQFTDLSTGEPTGWQWTFPAPGGTFSGQTPPPQAIPAGTSQVSLTVSNIAGTSASVTVAVTVNGPPAASFTISSNPAGTNTPVTFNASTSTDPNLDPLTYSWDLNGDNVYTDATGAVQSATFPTAGSYLVGVRVTDGHGGTDTLVKLVTVLPDKAPAVTLSPSPTTPSVGALVTFTANATDQDGTVSAIEWDLDNDGQFDDGTGATATWTFLTPGSRIVAVRATDDMGVATIAFQTIDVAGSTTGSSTASTTPSSAPLSTPQDSASSSRRSRLLSPFPIVRIRGLIQRGSVRISLLSVVAPGGATVKVLCRGRSCTKKSVKRRVAAGKKSVRFRTLEKRMRKGTFIQVFVTAPGLIGKYTSFTIRSKAAPSRHDRCVKPGHAKPVNCPAQ
jgi:PKD repeat protein